MLALDFCREREFNGVMEDVGSLKTKKEPMTDPGKNEQGVLAEELEGMRGKSFFRTQMEALKAKLGADPGMGLAGFFGDFGRENGGNPNAGWDEFLMYLNGDGHRNANYAIGVDEGKHFKAAAALAVMEVEAEVAKSLGGLVDKVGMYYAVLKKVEGEGFRGVDQRRVLGVEFARKLVPTIANLELPIARNPSGADLELLSFLGAHESRKELGEDQAKIIEKLCDTVDDTIGLFQSAKNRELDGKVRAVAGKKDRNLYRSLLGEIFKEAKASN